MSKGISDAFKNLYHGVRIEMTVRRRMRELENGRLSTLTDY